MTHTTDASTANNYDFLVNKTDLNHCVIKTSSAPAIDPGQALISIDRFALTANNITYAVAGDMIGYWQFFPAEANFGRIPVWGIGTVRASKVAGIEIGTRYYGYFPMSSSLVVTPRKISAQGFTDYSDHRQNLPAAYNHYALMSTKNGFLPSQDNHQILYRPLLMTAFLLEDFFFDNNFFNAEQILLSSASSKTAFSTALLLKHRTVNIIGLTSAGNKHFTESLGLYDRVVSYEEITLLNQKLPTAYIDLSGNQTVLTTAHQHFTENLVYNCSVGLTHWQSRSAELKQALPGAKPQMFFAPDQIRKRHSDWGTSEFQRKLTAAWLSFLDQIDHWVTIQEHSAPANIERTYLTVLNGPVSNLAYVLVNR